MSPPRGLVAVRRRPPPPTRIPREDSGPASRVPCPPPALLCSPLRLLILKHVLPAPPSSVKAFVSKGQVQTRNSTSPGEAALTSRPNRAGPSARLSHFQLSHRGAGSVCFSPENAFCSVTNSIADVTQFVQQDADFFFNSCCFYRSRLSLCLPLSLTLSPSLLPSPSLSLSLAFSDSLPASPGPAAQPD